MTADRVDILVSFIKFAGLYLLSPGRSALRAIKRRPKNFHFLNKPKHEMGNLSHRNKGLVIHPKSALS